MLRAGILPALRERPAGAPRLAAVRVTTPGGRHTSEHAARLTAVPAASTEDVLLVVDQFEEVFTLCPERERFLDLLLTALDEDSRLRVVIAVRADFLDRCAQHPGLAAALRDATVVVGAMSAAELREAVVKPAADAGLIVERSLTARIVEEAVQEPGGLPLMSHALLATWRRRRGRVLTEEMYEAAGGIHGAVATTAEDLFRRLTPSQAVTARRILLRLITPGEGTEDTRRPIDRAELDAVSSETAAVLEQLVRARLLTLDGCSVDLAHEALISAWPRYRAWIDQERERLRLHRRLTDAARTWMEHDHDPDTLYRGSRLTAAADAFAGEARQALSSPEAAFLDAGTAARDHESRQAARTARLVRNLTIALYVLVVVALTASLLAWNEGRASHRARRRAAAGAVLSADGATVTAARSDGSVTVLDTATGRTRETLRPRYSPAEERPGEPAPTRHGTRRRGQGPTSLPGPIRAERGRTPRGRSALCAAGCRAPAASPGFPSTGWWTSTARTTGPQPGVSALGNQGAAEPVEALPMAVAPVGLTVTGNPPGWQLLAEMAADAAGRTPPAPGGALNGRADSQVGGDLADGLRMCLRVRRSRPEWCSSS
ncbi:hypothetical protein ACFVXE_28040 [Streptomyces sp. NPDC058231]|uniref:nSTAND1 domain-containing NTPase n=1 Tax=Streptomyces sp. NPDC058231 TaxID=3346392 RepID=UPI0036EB6927